MIPPFHRSSCLSFFFCSYSLPFFLSFLVIQVHIPLSKKNRRPKCINLARKFSSSFQKRWWSLSEKRNPSNETVWKYDLRKKVIEDEKTFWYFCYCCLLFYSVFILVQSTKTLYLSHQGENMNFQTGPWNSEYQKFNTSDGQSKE